MPVPKYKNSNSKTFKLPVPPGKFEPVPENGEPSGEDKICVARNAKLNDPVDKTSLSCRSKSVGKSMGEVTLLMFNDFQSTVLLLNCDTFMTFASLAYTHEINTHKIHSNQLTKKKKLMGINKPMNIPLKRSNECWHK
jgi:hypothetical protein